MTKHGWIGVDFDGTLATTMDWKFYNDGAVGEPIWPMIERVREWLKEGKAVRIFTARACDEADPHHIEAIERFCFKYFGQSLPVTNKKDFDMIELWDDRAVQVEPNVGEPVTYWQSRV